MHFPLSTGLDVATSGGVIPDSKHVAGIINSALDNPLEEDSVVEPETDVESPIDFEEEEYE